MLVDLHTHSRFSFDAPAHSTVSAMCERAVKLGLSCLAITDHCDINGEGAGDAATRAAAFAEIEECKKRFAGKLTLLGGIELGQAAQFPAEARAILSEHPFDFVLGSLHNFKDVEDFYYMDFSQMPEEQIRAIFDRTLDELCEMCALGLFHSLAHITYPHRYLRRDGRDVDFSLFENKLRTLFSLMVEKNIALEVNTSTLASAGMTLPSRDLLALYRDCGGRLLTIGSDAHAPSSMARGFTETVDLLRALGFTAFTFPTSQGIMTFPFD